MSNDDFIPKKLHFLDGDEQIKAYTHPTRILLLQMLAKEKRTISSAAKELGVHPANITHHFKLLEKTGLVLLVEKRDTGRNLEKYYRSIAYNFSAVSDDSALSNKKALSLSILKNDLSVAINTVKDDDGKEMTALLGTARIDRDNAGHFIARLQNLMMEFKSCNAKDGVVYNMSLALYPNDVDFIAQDSKKVELK